MESDTGSRKVRQEVQIMNSHEQHIETYVGEQTTISDIKMHFYAHHQKEVPAKARCLPISMTTSGAFGSAELCEAAKKKGGILPSWMRNIIDKA